MQPRRTSRLLIRAVVPVVAVLGLGVGMVGAVGALDTDTISPVPLELQAPDEVRVEVGSSGSVTAEVVGGGADGVEVGYRELPPGAEASDGRVQWAPTDAGTWVVEATARDAVGRTVRRPIRFVARYPAHDQMVLGLGDSVASGHGLQRRDYLGGDECWRDADEAYPGRVADALVDAVELDAQLAQVHLVACSAATTGDLLDQRVGGGPDDVGADELTQLEWAVRTNPTLVTVTVGANDLGFIHPERLLDGEGIDRSELDDRLAGLRDRLARVLDRLAAGTDADVVVTGYHNPTAERPQGVEGCREACFRRATEIVVGELNDTIREAVASVTGPDGARVRFADVAPAFEGHGAPNGYGPDGWRAAGFGAVGGLLGADGVAGVQPYCSMGEAEGEPWVNAVDCVHPTTRGATAYADTVVDVLVG